MSKSLAERAATMTPMSAEEVAQHYKEAYDPTANNSFARHGIVAMCASHEAIRAQLHREREATAAVLDRIMTAINQYDESRYSSNATIEAIEAILRGR